MCVCVCVCVLNMFNMEKRYRNKIIIIIIIISGYPTRPSAYGPFRALRRHLELKLKLKLNPTKAACTISFSVGHLPSSPLSTPPPPPPPFVSSRRLVGLVVRRLPRERKVPSSNPARAGIFSGSSHTSDFKIGTPVATLPGAWRCRVSTGTGRPGVSLL